VWDTGLPQWRIVLGTVQTESADHPALAQTEVSAGVKIAHFLGRWLPEQIPVTEAMVPCRDDPDIACCNVLRIVIGGPVHNSASADRNRRWLEPEAKAPVAMGFVGMDGAQTLRLMRKLAERESRPARPEFADRERQLLLDPVRRSLGAGAQTARPLVTQRWLAGEAYPAEWKDWAVCARSRRMQPLDGGASAEVLAFGLRHAGTAAIGNELVKPAGHVLRELAHCGMDDWVAVVQFSGTRRNYAVDWIRVYRLARETGKELDSWERQVSGCGGRLSDDGADLSGAPEA